jgi:hypothetical protein
MPQPLVGAYKRISRGPADALAQRPRLAAQIGMITAMWAYIEYGVGLTLSHILGGEAMLGTTIYLALRSEGPQRTVIKAAAQAKLSSDLADAVLCFLERMRDGSVERNRVIHGIWEAVESYPDSLVWTDPKALIRWDATRKTSPSSSVVYNEQDFAFILSRLKDLSNDLAALSRAILTYHGEWPPKPQKFDVTFSSSKTGPES